MCGSAGLYPRVGIGADRGLRQIPGSGGDGGQPDGVSMLQSEHGPQDPDEGKICS